MGELEKFTITEDEANLAAPSFAVLVNEGKCWKCGALTDVAAIWVPSYTEIDHEDGDHFVSEDAAVLHYVGGLTAEVHPQVLAAAPWLRYAHTEGTGAIYLANHCRQCETVQGDWFVFGMDGPFFPQTPEEMARIKVMPGQGEFHGIGSPLVSSWVDELVR